MYGKAVITLKDKTKRIFKADDEDKISNFLYELMGDDAEEELSGVPTFIEASSWCPLACIGDTFERDLFSIKIIE